MDNDAIIQNKKGAVKAVEDMKLTREQKRRKQKLEADVKGVAWIVLIAALGALVAMLCMSIIRGGETEKDRGNTVSASHVEKLAETQDVHAAMIQSGIHTLEPAREEMEKEPRYLLTETERDIVERVVMAEAGNEDFGGMCLVAQCILNTCEARGMTPVETVTEKNQYTTPAAEASESVKQAVAAVFDDGHTVTDEPVRWFYAPKYSEGRWHERALVFVLEHGGHRFFKEG